MCAYNSTSCSHVSTLLIQLLLGPSDSKLQHWLQYRDKSSSGSWYALGHQLSPRSESCCPLEYLGEVFSRRFGAGSDMRRCNLDLFRCTPHAVLRPPKRRTKADVLMSRRGHGGGSIRKLVFSRTTQKPTPITKVTVQNQSLALDHLRTHEVSDHNERDAGERQENGHEGLLAERGW